MTTTRSAAPKNASRRPDDKPFDFNLDDVAPDSDLDPFVIHWQGKRWTFAHVQSLDCWELIDKAVGGEMQMVLATFQLALGDQYDDFRKHPLPQYKLMPLFRTWLKHCGTDPETGGPLTAS